MIYPISSILIFVMDIRLSEKHIFYYQTKRDFCLIKNADLVIWMYLYIVERYTNSTFFDFNANMNSMGSLYVVYLFSILHNYSRMNKQTRF